MKRLGVNIDHVATIRNARGESHPKPLKAAFYSMACGANSITIHLREDRRHIKDKDAFEICSKRRIPVNLEISTNNEIVKKALKIKPNFICLVPEKRKEITTEGGLNLNKNKQKLKNYLNILNKNKIRTSLFINSNLSDIKIAKSLGTKCIEIHTGKISNKIKKGINYGSELIKIKKSIKLAKLLDLEVHAGHGMDFKTAKILSKLDNIDEFNIGHFIVGESIFWGFKNTITKFKNILK